MRKPCNEELFEATRRELGQDFTENEITKEYEERFERYGCAGAPWEGATEKQLRNRANWKKRHQHRLEPFK